ncbi:fungal-specific transcription factor domain-containing protein [Gymnopilus junonius]|uniref:Fungal-specific transcription factor domain-containing protein n=1 Tax=Gymnopilus junonius TaxID=109634 RepID=A0A9P5NRM4_GYMJU|nr:fungal-specific transcription factor domain-containing protein [Gymnopilus junonius]
MILAVGCLVDLKREPDHPDAEKYHQLARASLCEIPVMEETNVETITALFYEIWYLLVFSDKKKAAGYAWGLMGLTAKLAQSIGLHRNGGKSKVIPEEVEKRRSLFWELLYLDARLSLSLGRPPSLSINHMDCLQPSYTPEDGSDSQHYYQEWKHSCYKQCLAPVLDAISKPHLEYETVLDLDKHIRDFSIPAPLRNKDIQSRSLIMQRASLTTALEAVLLQLHRQFFTRALSGPEEAFNKRHKYAASVVAVFLSASRMIATVQELYNSEPHLAARILGYWSNAFSAAVALCLLVSRAPFTCLSPAALQELERARILFRSAKVTCPRAQQVLPMLEAMIDKANYIFNCWSTGQEVPTIVLRHITEDPSLDFDSNSGSQADTKQQTDSFGRSHRSLSQCIVEAHQRAKALFPLRKPCQCSSTVAQSCPPSHSWAPVPRLPSQMSPVLPDIPFVLSVPSMSPGPGGYSPAPQHASLNPASRGYSPATNIAQPSAYRAQSEGFYSHIVLPADGPSIPSPPLTLSPSSKLAVVDSINFEMGALQSNSDQALMAFF